MAFRMSFSPRDLALMAVASSILAGCTERVAPPQATPARVVVPVFDMVSAGGPGNGEGWTAIGSTATRPALSLYENRRPVLVLTCEGVQTKVQVRGFEPRQAWPQPDLTLQVGAVSRAMPPGVRNIGEQVAYEIQFRLADEVLDEIAAGAPIRAEFDAQGRAFQPIPEPQRRAFAEGCAALVPAGMRQAGR